MKEVGKGSQEIAKIVEGERMDLNIHFLKPMESDAQAWMGTENASEKQTKVKWGFHSKMSYPMNIMLVFMNMDDMVGKDFAKGLASMKAIVEAK